MLKEKLPAGFSRKESTPKCPVPLSGFGSTMTRVSDACLDRLCITAIAMT